MVAHLLWEQEVAGSSPAAPTKDFGSLRCLALHLSKLQGANRVANRT